jgi:hypothetical protein
MKTKYVNFIRKTACGSIAIPMLGARVPNGLFRKPGKNQSSPASKIKKYSRIFNCLLLLFISNAQAVVISYVSPGNTFSHSQIDLVQLPSNNNDWIGSIETVPNASAESVAKATTLKAILDKMGTKSISTSTGTGDFAIKVGTVDEWRPYFDATPYDSSPDEYFIITGSNSLAIAGKTQDDLEKGIYRFLELIGYRQYFPTSTWEYTPSYADGLRINFAVAEKKIMNAVTGIGVGSGIADWAELTIPEWSKKNRIYYSEHVNFGHAWQLIIGDNQDEFDHHIGEYVSSVGNKLCVLEPQVQAFALARAKKLIDSDPNNKYLTVSMSASDGPKGWDEDCKNTHEQDMNGLYKYNPSDRQISLANYVQEQLSADPKYASVRVAIMAYGDTSVAPTIPINPNLVIVITNGFFFNGATVSSVKAGYQAQGAKNFALYDYYSVFPWDNDQPGISRLTSTTRLMSDMAMVDFNSNSPIKLFTGEGSDSWGPGGLGYYILAKFLTPPSKANTNFTNIANAIKNDFYQKAFGPASAKMQEFYELIDGDPVKPLLSTDLIHRMYDLLKQSLELTTNQNEINRINDLVLYTRYVELFRGYQTAFVGTAKTDAVDLLMGHVYRIRQTQIVCWRCLFNDAGFAPSIDELAVKYNMVMNANTPTDGNPWNGASFTQTEIDQLITDGLLNNPLMPFTPVFFSNDLVKPTAFDLDLSPHFNTQFMHGNDTWYLYLKTGQTQFTFTAQGGIAYKTKGDSTIRFVNSFDGTILAEVTLGAYDPRTTYNVSLPSNVLIRVEIIDKAEIYFNWPDDFSMTRINDGSTAMAIHASYSGYFYVPKGTTTIGVFLNSKDAQLIDPNGKSVLATPHSSKSFFSYSFKPGLGLDGKVWQLKLCGGDCFLYTVPPEFALSPRELLLPREVVQADGL